MPIAANVMLAASVMVASGSSLAAAPGPAALTTLKEGEVRHGFTARAIFSGLSGTPIGARFVHRTGTVADMLFFASVPQLSISVRSIPVSDRGEPHALEHLVVRRGLSGAYLKMLLTMRLAVGAATTDRDRTYYQFRTSAGREAFYELLAQHLSTLVRPDFTDEEVRREVANLEVLVAPDGRRTLLMKGAVYNEMVGNMARPGYRQPRVLKQMVFGKEHPLALNAGGDPVQLWDLTPESVRAFHSANYQIGPNLELVAALPVTWSADSFLKRLDTLLTSLAPAQVAPAQAPLPPLRPASRGEIRIGAYPSASADAPQDVLIGWQALPELTPDEWDALEVLLHVIGDGETSYLHHDLVDEKTRSVDSGVTAVAAGLEYVTAAYPYVTLSGLPASALETTHLERLRALVVKRCRGIAEMPDGSSELSELATRVRSRFAAARREYLKFVDSPPNFGQSGDRRWHDRLNRVVHAPGFMKSVAPLAHYERLDREMAAGRNPWRRLVLRARLSEPPYVVALRPDPGLADREKKDTAARLRRYETQLAERLGGGDVQQALAAFSAEQEAKTAGLTARDQAAPKPRFVSDPPLTLDDVPFEQSRLANGVPLVRVHFDTTPFTDVAVAFDLSRVPPDEWILLPLLDAVLSDTGVTTRDGEALDYAQARERREGQIYRFSIAPIGNAATRRHELEVAASAASVEEISRAVEWMENHTLRAGFGGNARARLIDACRKAIQAHRGVLERPEYEWSMDLATAFEYQDDPLQLALSSVFTRLRSITRLRWRLEDPSAEDRKRIYAELAGVEGLLANRAERAVVAAQLESLAGELGETLRYELSMLPPDRWHEDLLEVVRDLRADLDVGAARVLADFERLRRRVLVQRGARTRITASRANAELAAKLLDAFLAKLPGGSAATPPVYGSSSVQARLEQRYGRLSRPVHVGFVRRAATSGVHVVSASGPSYTSPSRTAVLDLLTVGVFAGRGPHSFYMRTTGAGLAFSNGIVAQRSRGRILYYAERCPDLVQTIKFVGDLAATHPTDDPFFVDYSLAYAFADDFRGANDFSSRGAALAQDLADGITPERVARFRRLLMETAREKDALVHIRERRPDAVGRVIVGYGRNVSASPGASAFVIAPEELLTKYETFLKEQGEADRLVRLFPRDFWPRPGEVVKPREESAGAAMRNMEPRQ